MKWIRRIARFLIGIIAVTVLALVVLYIVPPSQQEFTYERFVEPRPDNEKQLLGFYQADDGKEYQISFRATNGLQLNYFSPSRAELKSLFLTRIDDNSYDTDGDLSSAEVTFRSTITDSTQVRTYMDVSTSKTNFSSSKTYSLFYSQQEVQYANEGIGLSALLMIPYESNGIAIAFIHGSGFSDRDNFWYMHQADFLARQGFTILLPDKRGCGRSGGEWHTSSFVDFANDTQAGLDFLRTNYTEELSAFGVLGLSQGAWISQVLQQDYEKLDFAVEVVGSAVSPVQQVRFEVMKDIENSGVPGFIARPVSLVFAKRARGKRKIWWDKNGDFDPVKTLGTQQIPVLRIYGMEDTNVPVERSLFRLDSLMTANPTLPITIHTFEDSGHGLIDPVTEWVREDYLDLVAEWIVGEVNSE